MKSVCEVHHDVGADILADDVCHQVHPLSPFTQPPVAVFLH
jgi:hypothetical protein